MKIGINGKSAIGKGGVSRYTRSLVEHLRKLDSENEYAVLGAEGRTKIDLSTAPNSLYRTIEGLENILWEQVTLPFMAKREKIDILHYPSAEASVFYRRNFLVTIHDMFPYLFPESYRPFFRTYWRTIIPIIAKNSNGIITVSENSKKDIMELLGIREEKIYVIYNGVDSSFRKQDDPDEILLFRKNYNLEMKYILYVGQIEPRKNLVALLKAYKKLLEQENVQHSLVIAGEKNKFFEDIFRTVKALKINDKVKFLGFIPDSELPLLYNASDLFVFPSLYEGFGLPVLEAMACGVPVISSDISSIPEIAGEAAILVNPENIDELAEAMRNALTNNSLRKAMIEKGVERAGEFTWEASAKKHIAVYENLLHA